jgi:hypothetical protein
MMNTVALVLLGLSLVAAREISGQSLRHIGIIDLSGPKGQRFVAPKVIYEPSKSKP